MSDQPVLTAIMLSASTVPSYSIRSDYSVARLWRNSLRNGNPATQIQRDAFISHTCQTLLLYVFSMKWAHPCQRH